MKLMEGEVVIVAVDASKEITDYALEWAVCNVIKAMDILILLAVLPSSRGRPPASGIQAHQFLYCLLKKWGLMQKKNDHSANHTGLSRALEQEVLQRINNVFEQMLQQTRSAHNIKKVHTEVKVVADAQLGCVAAKAQELEATWVILDRRLKKEGDLCLKQLDCNVVVVDHAIPKILRAVNPMTVKNFYISEDQSDPTVADMLGVLPNKTVVDNSSSNTRSSSSLSTESPGSFTDGSFSVSAGAKEQLKKFEHRHSFLSLNSQYFHQEDNEVDDQATFSISTSYSKSQTLISKTSSFDILDSPRKSQANSLETKRKSQSGPLKTKGDMKNVDRIKAIHTTLNIPARQSTDSVPLWQKPESLQKQLYNQHISGRHSLSSKRNEAFVSPTSSALERTSSIRKAMSISIKHPPMPPPLCSICKHSAPILGKTPRKFSYKEITRATDGFSNKNFLAEGGYGAIYKGVLPDGQVVAVKQHKMLSAQGASEFVSEVEVLSCAQHRNLVVLVGYCIETEWLLIYEFACNGSLDMHLYGRETNKGMSWSHRMKVAKGAARGLRYLHEDCRVGCIVHRDFRPNNILLTHDFKPMVGDFGLARWQADGHLAEETRVIGAFGYLAPEYTQTGLITEKADVYAFGVVLLELLSGIRATDFSRNTGKQFVMEWGQPLLEKKMMNEIMDPRLEENYVEKEVECMMYAASLSISPNPEQRPTMSKVLKILEGDIAADMAYCYAGQKTPDYPRKYMNNIYGAETPTLQTPNSSNSENLLLQQKHKLNIVPPRLSLSGRRNNDFPVALEPLTASQEHEMVSSQLGNFNRSDALVSGEYQTYLQGSLAKFIQSLNEKQSVLLN